jgi:N-acetylglucosamine malate deacetylase 1
MNKTVLIVAAHADDEVLGCAGTIAKHVASKDIVHLLFMTNGVGSRNITGNEEYERELQSKNAADLLGITSINRLNFPDNKMDTVPLLDVVKEVEKIILKIQPEIIYTHHIGDLNIDHQITHKAAITACRPQPDFCVKEIYAFEVLSSTEWQTPGVHPFTPNVFNDISDFINIKKNALEFYHYEMHQPTHSRSVQNTIRLAELRGNSVGFHYAEAFMLQRLIK